MIRENYAVWSKGVSPIGCFNTKPERVIDEGWYKKSKMYYDGAIAVCDDSGCVIIPKELHVRSFYEKLVAIEEKEDLWFDRLDRRHENTFDIVCN